MADKQIVVASIQVETGNSNTVVKELNENVNKTKSSLKDIGTTAGTTGKAIEGSTSNFSKLKDKMSELPGPLGAAGEGVNKLSSTFKALLANPVVLLLAAIVATLALMYKAFTNTFEGGQKVEQVFSGIKAAGQALLDNLGHIGSAIVKLFQFDFSGAVAEIKGVAKAAGDAYNVMSDLTKQAQELHKEQLANDLDQANRAKQLAILREQSTDDSISPAKRRAALKELQKAAEENSKSDIDLAKRTTDNLIAQATLQKDGALKNQDEINAAKIKQIQVETDNANELRRIGKQVTAADKQEAAERAAAAKAAAEAAKAQRQKTIEFNNNLRKLEHENEVAAIKDEYQKEIKQLEIKIEEEKRINDEAYKDGKISREQAYKIQEQIDIQFFLAQDALTTKHNDELAKKEEDRKKKIADQKKKDEEQAKQEEKNRKEVEKKKLESDLKSGDRTINDPKEAFKVRQDAIDVEQQQIQQAFDNKLLTEQEYTDKVKELGDKRIQIADLERQGKITALQGYAAALSEVSGIVGQRTVAGKALAVAASLINTYAAIAGQLAAFSKVPVPGYAIAQAIATGLVGLANVRKIISVQIPGSGGGSGGVPGGSPTLPSALAPAAPVAPTASNTNITNPQDINNAGNAANPARVYMVESDGRDTQERIIRLNRAARLGG